MKNPSELSVRLEAGAATTALVYGGVRHRGSFATVSDTLILAHGAGAGQRSTFMVDFADALSDLGLDIVTFKQLGYLEIIKYLQEVFFSSDIRLPEVEYFQTRCLRIRSEQDVPVELDGELIGNCPVEFAIRDQKLRVLAPPSL